ncbi:MAG: bacterial transcriptional activator domain-containing protein, partial [Pseudonocardia sp.]|nr:bacterial transcriptional activator domain-containing protein [Pseudonocardia sp.]
MDLELGLLGGLTVRWQGNDVAVASAAARALLARLALDPARAAPRDELARLLWPERTQAAAFTNLRQTLARLRHAVPAVIADRARVGLVEGATSDVARFADLLAECAVHDHPAGRCERCIARRAEAARLYRGEFATGLELLCSAAFDDWLLLTREHLRYRFVELLDAVGDDHATAGEHTDAAAAARRQLDLEPWREGSHRRLMRALADAGDRAAALAQYVRCVQMLDDELGVAPDPATTALRDRIRAGAAPAVPRAARRSEVPDPGRVHGREAEIAAVAARLAAPEVRVVSVLGLGGVGKTTVAAAAARAIERDQDILVWRSLLNAPPPEVLLAGVLPAVGGPGLRDLPDDLDGRLDLLLDLLAARRCVLVLDNLESVLDGDGRWRPGHAGYGQLLAGVATADLSSAVLLTSREQPPGLDGGDTAVHTLRLTGLDAAEGRGLLAARGLVGPTAEHLVARYSGHPLALRLVSRTVQELFAGDLDAFLAVDPAIFDDVRSVLDELWERLSGLERLLLATLAVAREPLTVPALRARLRGPHTPRDLVEAVAALRRRSVVEVVHGRVGLQNVILEYLTARIVECACTAVTDGDTGPLDDCALLDPGAVEHVRDSQSRLVVGALAERLTARLGRAGARTAATGLLAPTGPPPGD